MVHPERSEMFRELFELIASFDDAVEVTMLYKMPTFQLRDGWVALANQKSYISLYTCDRRHIESYCTKHPEVKAGKGCLNFRNGDSLYKADLLEVVASALHNPKG